MGDEVHHFAKPYVTNVQDCRSAFENVSYWYPHFGVSSFHAGFTWDGLQTVCVHGARAPALGVRYRARSLRWRLGWLVLGCVLPLLALLAAEQYLQYSNNVGIVGQETLTLARGMSASVDLALEAHVQMLQALATSQALREGDLDGFRRRADELISEQGAVESILVLRPDGQMVMNTRVPAGAPLPVRSDLMSLRKAVQSGRAQISDLFNGTRSGRELVAVDIPIKDATGKILYILSMNPRLEAFADVIADQNLPRTWVAGIIDRRGLTVARLPNGDKEVGRPVSPGMLSSLDMPEGIVDTTSRDGVPVLAAFAHGPKHGWAVCNRRAAQRTDRAVRQAGTRYVGGRSLCTDGKPPLCRFCRSKDSKSHLGPARLRYGKYGCGAWPPGCDRYPGNRRCCFAAARGSD